MDEVREYRLQLEAVEESLVADPGNEELMQLQTQLKDLIELMTQQEQGLEETEERQKGMVSTFKVGDSVLAQWDSGDGSFHPARVTAITGPANAPMYTVTFLKYSDTSETLPLSGLRELGPDKKTAGKSGSPNRARLKERPHPVDSKTRTKKTPNPPKGSDQLDSGKSSWQKFVKKGAKGGRVGKSHSIGEKSMFRSPDDFAGKVGVVGSGKGMTKEQFRRGKHIHQREE